MRSYEEIGESTAVEKFKNVIRSAISTGISDIHITGGHSTVCRINGQIQLQNKIQWSPQEVDTLVKKLLSGKQIQKLRDRLSIDYSARVENVRLRINIFRTSRGLSIAVRLLPGRVPSIDQLNLHPSLHEISELNSGLVMICGATGTGKTTTIAAIIEEINQKRSSHIITLEDPVEYRFSSKKSFIQQREIDTDTPSFERGLLDALREDTDVIIIGELREPQSMRLCLNAAESGHLVITTLHATNAEEAVHRLCFSFPPQYQNEIRYQLASSLSWLISQRLQFYTPLGIRIPVLSIVRGTSSVKSLIRDNKLNQLEGTVQMSRSEGMFTEERYLNEYVKQRKNFFRPSKIFQASTDNAQEITYKSPITEPRKESNPVQPKMRSSDLAFVRSYPAEEGAGDGYISIEQPESMEDLMKQLDLSDYE
ncbi:MAG: PilT/PilU family type 4a pilus ATPase [Syntrophales bacterium]|nr:PilT/PilU family type 4a pilus ATPase [Syntrophales bacterium]